MAGSSVPTKVQQQRPSSPGAVRPAVSVGQAASSISETSPADRGCTKVRARSVTPPSGSRRRCAESPAAGGAVFRLLDPDLGRSVVPVILPASSGAPSERVRRGAYVNLQHGRRSLESGAGVAASPAPTATVAPQRRSLDAAAVRPERETPTETHVVPGQPIETDFFDPPSVKDGCNHTAAEEPDSADGECGEESPHPADESRDSIQSNDSVRSAATVRRNNSYKLSVGGLTSVSVDLEEVADAAADGAVSPVVAAEVGSTVAIRPGGARNIEPVRVARYKRQKGKLFIDPSIFKQSAKDPKVDVPKSLQISKHADEGDTEIW